MGDVRCVSERTVRPEPNSRSYRPGAAGLGVVTGTHVCRSHFFSGGGIRWDLENGQPVEGCLHGAVRRDDVIVYSERLHRGVGQLR